MKCQICYTDIGSLSLSDKQAHYEHHLHDSGVDASQIATSSRVSTKPDTSQNINEDPQGFKKANKRRDKWKPPLFSNLEKKQDVFWYPAMEEPPPDNFTPGIITLLKKALLKSHAQGITVRAVLSYERTTYINNQMWDMGWGCGYRNFLMASAALMDQPFQPMYFPLLDKPISPGIRNLQQWIEQAWKDGYDQEGYQQLHRLVETHKWIGTSDLCTAFVHRGIPAELADFQAEDDGDIRPLTKWIVDYFDKYKVPPSNSLHEALSGATPVHSVDCMPLILQNAGHSRLVVGYEMGKGGVINLLVFDPSIKPNKAIRKAALHAYSTQRNRDARSSLSSLGQKRRHSGEEIVFLGASNSTARKRLKGESNPRPPGDVDLLAEGDDDIVLLGERKRSNEKKTGASTRKIQEDDFLWKEVIKLCQWQGERTNIRFFTSQ
ncbi:hypothetical protein E1B28_002617 [Marasmius oreades]|uniref:UFSP1/2/DUB catalytic domain-containing protein n=1 Tax=Marasmius oreades TaxID=181124 RepID=A0A9P7RNZ4_9AGAR|nr:uncharacterized protein E1B28_002617 [Marasmius oreades]KAG7086678.1 hypothetical protein E1B28_002617 [Marasmius oreades]